MGLAVDDIKGVQEQAQLKRIAMKVNVYFYAVINPEPDSPLFMYQLISSVGRA